MSSKKTLYENKTRMGHINVEELKYYRISGHNISPNAVEERHKSIMLSEEETEFVFDNLKKLLGKESA